MAEISTPALAKTSDDTLLIANIVAEWAQANPDLASTLVRFISEDGLKTLLTDSVTTTDSNLIASATAAKLAMRQYVTENFSDAAAPLPAAGATALGRNGRVVIDGDGNIVVTYGSLTIEQIISIAGTTSQFSSLQIGAAPSGNLNGIRASGTIESDSKILGLLVQAGATGIITAGPIVAGTNAVGCGVVTTTGVTASGIIQALNHAVKCRSLEIGGATVIDENQIGTFNALSGTDITASGKFIGDNAPKICISVDGAGAIQLNKGSIAATVSKLGTGDFKIEIPGGGIPAGAVVLPSINNTFTDEQAMGFAVGGYVALSTATGGGAVPSFSNFSVSVYW